MAKPITIELGNEACRDLFFRPLGRKVRGEFDAQRLAKRSKDAAELMHQWDRPIPGQKLTLDIDKRQGHVDEVLHAAEYSGIVEKLKQRGFKLEPKRQTFEGADVDSWLYYMHRAVQSGDAKLVSGDFPAEIPKPRKSFVVRRVASDAQETVERLVAICYAMLTPEQRKQAETMLGSF